MTQKETALERQARIAFEKHLFPAEELLAFTRADIVGLIRRSPYLVGLTRNQLLLVMMPGREVLDQELSIRLTNIRAVKWRSGVIKGFRVEIGGEDLNFRFGSIVTKGTRIWVRRAKELVELLGNAIEQIQNNEEVRKRIAEQRGINIEVQTGVSEGKLVVQRIMHMDGRSHLKQAVDFDTLGLQRAAHQELNEALTIQPALSMEPGVIALQKRLSDDSAAFKRTGLFFLVNAGLFVLRVVLFLWLGKLGSDARYLGRYLVPIAGFELYMGVDLYRGRSGKRSLALYWAAVWLFITLGFFFTDDSMFGSERNLWDLVMGISFSLAVILPLTGSRNQQRTRAATIIFILGCLVLQLSVLIAALIS